MSGPIVAPASGRPELRIRSRGRLPHFERDGASYFVTFRLFDSLPAAVLARMKDGQPRSSSREVEAFLDRGAGVAWLRDPRIAAIVVEALRHFDGDRYVLHAWCVMPNHVHVVFTMLPARTPALRTAPLSSVMHSWKSFSAKAANRVLGRSGPFWQREYYDHLIRDEAEFVRCIEYTLLNPAKAGLCEAWEDWPASGRGALRP